MKPGVPQHESVLTVQVDVDTPGHLLSFYGLEASAEPEDNAAYRLALPRFADLFAEVGIRATFFVVGDDLKHKANSQIVSQLHAATHEIANHTQTHNYGFSRLTGEQKRREIDQASDAIQDVVGQKPVGFRAPGYDVDEDTMRILIELGYRYDSSIMPSVLNLPFQLVAALKSQTYRLSGYGSLALIFAPNHRYRPDVTAMWRSTSEGTLWELPVSCVPYCRLPFYANFNLFTGRRLFELSLALSAGRDCNYVFHALEMLDPTEMDPGLYRHPNARLPLKQKIARCRYFLQRLTTGRRNVVSKELVEE